MNPSTLAKPKLASLNFDLRVSDFGLPSAFGFRPSDFPHHSASPPLLPPNPHFWRTEPATGVDPTLARRRPSFAAQHILCLARTGEALGMTRRVPGAFYRTAWFTCGQIKTKRHQTLQGAKRFLERTFTRTIPQATSLHGYDL